MKRRRHPVRTILALLFILCAALLLLGKYGLQTTVYELRFSSLPAAFDGFTVVQLSDLHGARFGEGNARLIRKIAEQDPDLIVLTGDFLDEEKWETELADLGTLLDGVTPLAPVYFVSGNHDWASGGLEELAKLLEDKGAHYLRNAYVPLERDGGQFILAGVEDPNGHADMIKPDALCRNIRDAYPDSFLLLLGHRNYWLEQYPTLPADLVLCGHAHGGIIRLPGLGGLLGTGGEFFPEHVAGVYTNEAYTLVVSRGLGNSVPIPRFWNTPEIVTIILHSK